MAHRDLAFPGAVTWHEVGKVETELLRVLGTDPMLTAYAADSMDVVREAFTGISRWVMSFMIQTWFRL